MTERNLVERLRFIICYDGLGEINEEADACVSEAAAEIERLTAENAKLRGALERIGWHELNWQEARDAARAALDDTIDLPRLHMGDQPSV